jgi:predicted permease
VSHADPPRVAWVLRAARWLGERLAPPHHRARWRQEWDAELGHESPQRPAPLALGMLADARALRHLDGPAVPHRATLPEMIMMMMQSLRFAVRSLRRSPVFATVSVLTLAVGLGGAAAIHTLLDRVVLDPLDYPDSERLVRLTNEVPGVGAGTVWHLATAQVVFYQQRARTLDALGVFRFDGANLEGDDGPARATVAMVSAPTLDLVGARAHVGRLITRDDDRPDTEPVAVLAHGFWQRRFGGDRNIVGRPVVVNGAPVVVVGVLEPGVRLPVGPPSDLWMPLRIDSAGPFQNSHTFPAMARLAPGASIDDARRELVALARALPERFPEVYDRGFMERYGFRPAVASLQDDVVGDLARNLWVLFGAVGLVLLVAAANVANLFLVRVEGRRREIAVRTALGAGKGALARDLLAESVVVAGAGGVFALAVAWWGVPALIGLSPDVLPAITAVRPDRDTLLFTLLLIVGVALVLALVPLLRLVGPRTLVGLGEAGRGASAGPGRQRLRSALVVSQVALALTLTVGAGLLVESSRRLQAVDPGFDPEGVLAAQLYLTPGRYASDVEMWGAYDRILEAVRALPGVTAVGMSQDVPLSGGFACWIQGFEDHDVYGRLESAGLTTCAGLEPTSPGYFEAMGIPLLAGRTFEAADNDDPSRGAVVVSRAFADRFWPDEDPLGKGVAPGRNEAPFYRVVGVVGDVKASTLDGDDAIAIYYPMVLIPESGGRRPSQTTLVVRTGMADPGSILPSLRAAVSQVDPTLPLANVRTMRSVVEESLGRVAFTTLLLQVAAGCALLLAAVGLYGVVSVLVARRRRELGMRLALGARPAQLEGMVVRASLVLGVVGVAIGVALALAVTRVLRGLLYGISPTHPWVFAAAAAALLALTLLASWMPARRAARIDAVEALRGE